MPRWRTRSRLTTTSSPIFAIPLMNYQRVLTYSEGLRPKVRQDAAEHPVTFVFRGQRPGCTDSKYDVSLQVSCGANYSQPNGQQPLTHLGKRFCSSGRRNS